MNGLTVWVYRSKGMDGADSDCTNGGLSSNHRILTLIQSNGPVSPSLEAPPVVMITRNLFGDEYSHLVPCDEQGKPLPGHWMAGGNFAYTSDSRFPNPYPLSIHDRQEN